LRRTFVAIAEDLVGLHATDPASVYLAARARMNEAPVALVEGALYEERRALRMLGVRRTMFVVPLELAAVVQAACTDGIAVKQRERYARMLEQGGVTPDGGAWLDEVCAATLAALEERGEAFATELSAAVPELQTKLSYGEGKAWGGSMSLTTPVLFLLAAQGRIVRGRPRGGGRAASIAGRLRPRGCRSRCARSIRGRRAPSSCAAGLAASGPVRSPTSRGGRG
jgi:hypothetical protein